MDKKQTQTSQQRTFNIVVAILLIISVIWWVIDEERDNLREGQLKVMIIDYESRYVTMVDGANRLYTSLKECRERED